MIDQGFHSKTLSQDVMGMNGAFLYIEFTEAEVKECFVKLKKQHSPILKPRRKKISSVCGKDASREYTRRFVIADRSLHNLLEYAYAGIFPNSVRRMENTWMYIRDPEQVSGETNWYRSLFGDKKVRELIEKVLEMRNKFDMRSDENKNARKAVILIKEYDGAITYFYKRILNKRNESIRKRYSVFTDQVLDIVYPQFLRELHKNNKI
jgi:hypothetical protein